MKKDRIINIHGLISELLQTTVYVKRIKVLTTVLVELEYGEHITKFGLSKADRLLIKQLLLRNVSLDELNKSIKTIIIGRWITTLNGLDMLEVHQLPLSCMLQMAFKYGYNMSGYNMTDPYEGLTYVKLFLADSQSLQPMITFNSGGRREVYSLDATVKSYYLDGTSIVWNPTAESLENTSGYLLRHMDYHYDMEHYHLCNSYDELLSLFISALKRTWISCLRYVSEGVVNGDRLHYGFAFIGDAVCSLSIEKQRILSYLQQMCAVRSQLSISEINNMLNKDFLNYVMRLTNFNQRRIKVEFLNKIYVSEEQMGWLKDLKVNVDDGLVKVVREEGYVYNLTTMVQKLMIRTFPEGVDVETDVDLTTLEIYEPTVIYQPDSTIRDQAYSPSYIGTNTDPDLYVDFNPEVIRGYYETFDASFKTGWRRENLVLDSPLQSLQSKMLSDIFAMCSKGSKACNWKIKLAGDKAQLVLNVNPQPVESSEESLVKISNDGNHTKLIYYIIRETTRYPDVFRGAKASIDGQRQESVALTFLNYVVPSSLDNKLKGLYKITRCSVLEGVGGEKVSMNQLSYKLKGDVNAIFITGEEEVHYTPDVIETIISKGLITLFFISYFNQRQLTSFIAKLSYNRKVSIRPVEVGLGPISMMISFIRNVNNEWQGDTDTVNVKDRVLDFAKFSSYSGGVGAMGMELSLGQIGREGTFWCRPGFYLRLKVKANKVKDAVSYLSMLCDYTSVIKLMEGEEIYYIISGVVGHTRLNYFERCGRTIRMQNESDDINKLMVSYSYNDRKSLGAWSPEELITAADKYTIYDILKNEDLDPNGSIFMDLGSGDYSNMWLSNMSYFAIDSRELQELRVESIMSQRRDIDIDANEKMDAEIVCAYNSLFFNALEERTKLVEEVTGTINLESDETRIIIFNVPVWNQKVATELKGSKWVVSTNEDGTKGKLKFGDYEPIIPYTKEEYDELIVELKKTNFVVKEIIPSAYDYYRVGCALNRRFQGNDILMALVLHELIKTVVLVLDS